MELAIALLGIWGVVAPILLLVGWSDKCCNLTWELTKAQKDLKYFKQEWRIEQVPEKWNYTRLVDGEEKQTAYDGMAVYCVKGKQRFPVDHVKRSHTNFMMRLGEIWLIAEQRLTDFKALEAEAPGAFEEEDRMKTVGRRY